MKGVIFITMNFCTECGTPLNGATVCPKCGAVMRENQEPTSSDKPKKKRKRFSVPKSLIKPLYYIGIAALTASAVIMFIVCIKNTMGANGVLAQMYLDCGTVLPSIAYFAFGMWTIIPALWLILNIGSEKNKVLLFSAVLGLCVQAVILFMYLSCIRDPGEHAAYNILSDIYKNEIEMTVILNVIAAFCAGAKRLSKKTEITK